MESRDFIPFVPLAGRVVQNGHSALVSYAIPCILPQGDPVNRASIPTERAVTLNFLGREISGKIIADIERQNNCELAINDVVSSPLRISHTGYEIFGCNARLMDIIADQICVRE